jgi:hypothetical protein
MTLRYATLCCAVRQVEERVKQAYQELVRRAAAEVAFLPFPT